MEFFEIIEFIGDLSGTVGQQKFANKFGTFAPSEFSLTFSTMAFVNQNLCAAFVLVACLSTVSAILRGENSTKGQFPYMASIQENSTPIVSGAIISDQYVLTVAYGLSEYVADPSGLTVYLGAWKFDKDAVKTEISEIIIHPGWEPEFKRNDIALVKTVRKIVFSAFVQRINLPIFDVQAKDGTSAIVSGFGLWFVSNTFAVSYLFAFSHPLLFVCTKLESKKSARNTFEIRCFAISNNKHFQCR